LVQICSTVISDGGYDHRGNIYRVSTSSPKTITSTEAPIIALRLKAGFKRLMVNIIQTDAASESNGDYRVSVYKYLSPSTSILTGGSWVDVNAYSGVEYNESASAFDPTGAIFIECLLAGTNAASSGSDISARFALILTSDIVGNSDIILVTARVLGLTGNLTKFWASVQYQELE